MSKTATDRNLSEMWWTVKQISHEREAVSCYYRCSLFGVLAQYVTPPTSAAISPYYLTTIRSCVSGPERFNEVLYRRHATVKERYKLMAGSTRSAVSSPLTHNMYVRNCQLTRLCLPFLLQVPYSRELSQLPIYNKKYITATHDVAWSMIKCKVIMIITNQRSLCYSMLYRFIIKVW